MSGGNAGWLVDLYQGHYNADPNDPFYNETVVILGLGRPLPGRKQPSEPSTDELESEEDLE